MTATYSAGIAMRPFAASLPMALLQARESSMRLFRADEPIDASQLADTTFILAPSLSRMLTSLEDRSLIERSGDINDNRRSLIALSDKGRALVQTVAPQSEELYNVIEKRFGAERLNRLLAELHDLATLHPLPNDQLEPNAEGTQNG